MNFINKALSAVAQWLDKLDLRATESKIEDLNKKTRLKLWGWSDEEDVRADLDAAKEKLKTIQNRMRKR